MLLLMIQNKDGVCLTGTETNMLFQAVCSNSNQVLSDGLV